MKEMNQFSSFQSSRASLSSRFVIHPMKLQSRIYSDNSLVLNFFSNFQPNQLIVNFIREVIALDTRITLKRMNSQMRHTRRKALHYSGFRVPDLIICKLYKLNQYVMPLSLLLQLVVQCNIECLNILNLYSIFILTLDCLFSSLANLYLQDTDIHNLLFIAFELWKWPWMYQHISWIELHDQAELHKSSH